jgi:hypothetical protein
MTPTSSEAEIKLLSSSEIPNVGTSHSETDNFHNAARASVIYTLQLATWLFVQPHKRYPISDHHSSSNAHRLVHRLAAKV